ncbi:ribosomal RNA small subunit methyltransferase A [Candidatus Saccharibacteria bacterium]|nr:ribosomal RNA small subunit methyltransferase A [Candidatus Saccharibacteria bacterium]
MTDRVVPKKSLGQHWLRDEDALGAMLQAADVAHDDTVLEIGPGLGTLTKHLLQRAAQVIAVEFDATLATNLQSNLHLEDGPINDKLTVVQQDILSFDLTSVPAPYKVVANIPYYLTSNLIRVLSESSNPPEIAVLLMQKEVAERVCAEPGNMSILSVTAQYFWEVSLDRVVPADLFEPAPKVDSQILVMHYRQKPLFDSVDTKQFFRLVKAGFGQKRKTLENSLSGGLHMSKEEARSLLEKANVSPQTRAQALSLADWHSIYKSTS